MFVYTKAIGTVGRMWGDTVPDRFIDSAMRMITYSQHKLCKSNEFINYDFATTSWHELGRNGLVETMLGDWLLMLDTDHVFVPDVLERLLYFKNKYKARVISGLYCQKVPPHAPVANLWDAELGIRPLTHWQSDAELIEVGPVGAGCLLVDKSVFNEIKGRTGQSPFSNITGLSEDYSFCHRCKELNIPIYLAPKVQFNHLAPRQAIGIDLARMGQEVQAAGIAVPQGVPQP